MKCNFRVGRSLFLQVLVCATASLAGASPSKPFVDFSRPGSDHLGIAGFPVLEVLPANENSVMIVARESPLQGNITYSSGYLSPAETFTKPPFFSFTIYGYHEKPKWKAIQSVTFKFGGQMFAAKPFYSVQGPDRDRSDDAQKSNFFETMVVKIPTGIAAQIVANNGVVVSTTPSSFYVPIPASKMDRFKQLVGSVEAISKREAVKAQAKSQPASAPKKTLSVRSGLPITEVFDEASGTTRLETAIANLSPNFAFSGMAWTEEQGKKLKPPFTALMVMAVSEAPIWENVDAVTLSFGTKKLRLTPNAHKSGQPSNGNFVEVMTVRVPYRDFLALAKSAKFYITVGEASFAVDSRQATGVRELARRIAK